MNVNTCSRTFCCFPFRPNSSFSEASVSPGRASYSIVSFRQPPVETACRTALRPTSPSVVRAAHLTASFQFVNTHRNRCFPRSPQAINRLPGRASYSLFS
ncbi:hypothetical protein, partial [Lysobacter enzymogenes]|uniref:hypothetical protein n=1 Tax=Lysobacter enzymogenes TaxID=69 RepID=UPI0019D295D1